MSSWALWISLPVALIVATALIGAYVKRNRKRKLWDMRPDPDKLSSVGGIGRYGLDPMTMAQTEYRRLEKGCWAPTPPENESTPAEADEKEMQDDRR